MAVAEKPAWIAAALVVLYVLWGSTYIAIRVLVVTAPPFLMASLRFAVAGAVLLAAARLRGEAWPSPKQWGFAGILGALFFLGGNGGVVWSETRVPSGVAALLVAMVPMWIALIEAVLGQRPRPLRIVGLLLGMVGVAILVGPGADDAGRVDPLGFLALVISSLCWSSGTVLSRRLAMPGAAMTSGAEMLAGCVTLGIAGLGSGELAEVPTMVIGVPEVAAFAWLLVAGSLVGFTVYHWLLKASNPAIASTYAFVNPIVAMLIGWFAGEALGPRVLVAGVAIVGAVALVVLSQRAEPMPVPPEE
jgi:drug/metabolite transporter (DMT)-like permease